MPVRLAAGQDPSEEALSRGEAVLRGGNECVQTKSETNTYVHSNSFKANSDYKGNPQLYSTTKAVTA